MNLETEIDSTYCLNLQHRQDRKLRAWGQFRRESLEVERISAVDASSVQAASGYRNVGARACGVSHQLAWRAARHGGAEAVIVFEDDVVLCHGFRERLEALELPEDWQVVYFGCVFRSRPEFVRPGLLKVTGPTWDMHGYLVRRGLWEEVGRELVAVSARTRVEGRKHSEPRHAGDNGWWQLIPAQRGKRRTDTACDVVLADYHSQVAAYAVWPPMAWQVQGLSNNENCVRGNYRPDGTQSIYRECIAHLPGVEEELALGRAGVSPAGFGVPPNPQGILPLIAVEGQDALCPVPEAQDGARDAPPYPTEGSALDSPMRTFAAARPVAAGNQNRSRGFLVSPYSPHSERMAYALACSLRRYNAEIPICILGQDYCCSLPWRGLAEVKTVRATAPHGSDDKWFNKLAALVKSPYEETIFLDCDIILLSDPTWWFDHLGTDDFTCFNRMLGTDVMPDEMISNVVNVHRMQEEFGVSAVPVIDGGGHYYYKKTRRGEHLVQAMAAVMAEALDIGPSSLYHRMAGMKNIPGADEVAYSIMAVQEKITMPEALASATKPIAIYLVPFQSNPVFDLPNGHAKFYDDWSGGEVQPGAVHFCHTSKNRPEYVDYIVECVRRRGRPDKGL